MLRTKKKTALFMMPVAMLYRYSLMLLVTMAMFSYKSTAQEICNNGKDDDNDGLIDLLDPDCQCHLTINGNLLLNASFEANQHCPVNYIYDSEYDIASYWKFSSYTNINEANFYHNLNCSGDSQQVVQHMQPELPLPQGNGFVAIYNSATLHPVPENEMMKGYVSQCLQAPLVKGEDYTLSFYAGRFQSWDNFTGNMFPLDVALFGNKDCNAVPFGKKYVQGNGCPANYEGWTELGKTTIHSNGEWVFGKISFTVPSDINVIAIGPDCSILPPINDLTDSTTFLDYHLYYLDDLHLLGTKDFPLAYIHVQSRENCVSLPSLQVPATTGASYQWYKDGIVVPDATSNTYQVAVAATASYNVVIRTIENCITSEPFLITPSQLGKVNIPADTISCLGDTLQLAPALAGIQYSINNGSARSNVSISQEGNYTITATDSYGCNKIFSTHVAAQNCADCNVYVPTAFTPNGDGLNDVFRATLRCFTTAFHCIIFDRWGRQIFESNNINKGWNGTFKGTRLTQGAYVYIINYKTTTGKSKQAKGVVLLME